MGMKNKSGYFAGNTSTGGPAIRQGLKFKLNIQYFAEMPKTKAQFDHIMADRRGHLANTPTNVSKVLEIANDELNFVGTTVYGKRVYLKTENETQYWVFVKDGVVQNAGANESGHHRTVWEFLNGRKRGNNK